MLQVSPRNSLLRPPAEVGAAATPSAATAGTAVLQQRPSAWPANNSESVSRFRSTADYQKCHVVLASTATCCPLSLMRNHFLTKSSWKRVYTVKVVMQNYKGKKKRRHCFSFSVFLHYHFPLFLPFLWGTQHISYFLALLLPPSAFLLGHKTRQLLFWSPNLRPLTFPSPSVKGNHNSPPPNLDKPDSRGE